MNFVSAAAVLLVLFLPQVICVHAQTIADSNIRISQIYTSRRRGRLDSLVGAELTVGNLFQTRRQ
jgi:hypothetical protein